MLAPVGGSNDWDDAPEVDFSQVISGGAGETTTGPPSDAGFAWPICARVSSEYGWRAWSNSYHAGIDQSADPGDLIGASADGVVSIVSNEPAGYGLWVEVQHEGGYATRYAHMRAFRTSVGEEVEMGDPLGEIGSTGFSTGPHLHFEILVDGEKVDPRRYLEGSPC